jgi:HlyD family secretion protein
MGKAEKSGGLKWIILGIVLVGAAVGGVWFVKNRKSDAPVFTTTKVARGDVTQAVTATGTLNPVLNVQVGSQISGIIQKLYADFNSVVKSNQVIAQLDAATYRANLNSAEGELANAQATLELAQINAKRSEDSKCRSTRAWPRPTWAVSRKGRKWSLRWTRFRIACLSAR